MAKRKPQPAAPVAPDSRGTKFLKWLDDNWMLYALIADSFGGSYTNLLHLAHLSGLGGVDAYTTAALFDALYYLGQKERQQDEEDADPSTPVRWYNLPTLLMYLGIIGTFAGNEAHTNGTPWSYIFFGAAPFVLMIAVYLKERRLRRRSAARRRALLAAAETGEATAAAVTPRKPVPVRPGNDLAPPAPPHGNDLGNDLTRPYGNDLRERPGPAGNGVAGRHPVPAPPAVIATQMPGSGLTEWLPSRSDLPSVINAASLLGYARQIRATYLERNSVWLQTPAAAKAGRRGDIPVSVLRAALAVKSTTAGELLRQLKAEGDRPAGERAIRATTPAAGEAAV